MSPAVETRTESRETLAAPAAAVQPAGAFPRSDGPPAPFGSGVHRPERPTAEVHRHGLLQAVQSFLYIVIVALFIVTFTVQPFRIPSESMEPTLLVGDFLLVDKAAASGDRTVEPSLLAPVSTIHRGDLIVFHYPVDPSLHLVKRVVGLPGDHLRLHDGHVYIDGRAQSEPFAIFLPAGPDSYRDEFPRMASADPGVDSRWWVQMRSLVSHGELTVPANSYFVLGDNRNDSEDSRYWGFVPQANIVGKPFLIYFSLKGVDAAPNLSALPNPNVAAASHRDTPLDFARWDRSLHIIY